MFIKLKTNKTNEQNKNSVEKLEDLGQCTESPGLWIMPRACEIWVRLNRNSQIFHIMKLLNTYALFVTRLLFSIS